MIEPVQSFDYGMLDADTRTFVQYKAEDIHTRLKRTAEDVIAIGLDLIAIQDRLKRVNDDKNGLFLKWLHVNFDLSQRTALKFMAWSERFGGRKVAEIAGTSTVLSELYDSDDAIIEMVECGQIPATIPAIREAKRELQQKIDAPVAQPLSSLDDIFPGFAKFQESPPSLPESWKLPQELRGDVPVKSARLEEPARAAVMDALAKREIKREEVKERLAQLKTRGVELPAEKYGVSKSVIGDHKHGEKWEQNHPDTRTDSNTQGVINRDVNAAVQADHQLPTGKPKSNTLLAIGGLLSLAPTDRCHPWGVPNRDSATFQRSKGTITFPPTSYLSHTSVHDRCYPHPTAVTGEATSHSSTSLAAVTSCHTEAETLSGWPLGSSLPCAFLHAKETDWPALGYS